MATETITLRLVAQDLMSGNVSKAVGKIDTLAKRGGIVGSIFQGVGQRIGQMLNPLDLASRGFGVLTDVMMDGVKAAIEDEKAQEQLNQTIRANVKGWDENTAAIEDAIKAGAALAFTDDEIRAGLNQLIPRTKDIAEANRLNALAMDLARAKNLSLEESATLVGKAYSGQASALRRAGIAIKDTKNSTRALAELQSMVTGQADKYASTAEGSMAVLQITIDELVESLGYELLPYLKDFANYLRTDVIPRIDDATEAFRLLGDAASVSLSFIPRGNDGLSRFNDGLDGMSESIEKTAVVVTGTWGSAMESAADDVEPLIASINDVKRVILTLPNTFTIAVVDMKARIKNGKEDIIEEFRDLAFQTKHPFAEKRYATWLGEQVEKAERKMKNNAKKGKWGIVAQYRDLRDQIMIELLTLPGNLSLLQLKINGILGSIFSTVTTAVENLGNIGVGGIDVRDVGGSNFMPSAGILSNTSPGSGMGSGGHINVNVTHIGSMSEADGQRFARTVAPHINRELGQGRAMSGNPTTPLPSVRVAWRPEQHTRIANGTFETNTTGWATTAGINAAGTSITRITTDAHSGSACASVVCSSTDGSGVNFDLGSETFFSEASYGAVYVAVAWLKRSSGSRRAKLILGSEGTSSDRATLTITDLPDAWTPYVIRWLPTGTRTDVQLAITNGSAEALTIRVDDVAVYLLDGFTQVENGSFEVDTTGWVTFSGGAVARSTAEAFGGAACMRITASTTANSGARFLMGGRFLNGRTYRARIAAKAISGVSSTWEFGFLDGTTAYTSTTTFAATSDFAWYTFDATLAADQSDLRILIRHPAASAAVLAVDEVEVYEASDDLGTDAGEMTWTLSLDGSIDPATVEVLSESGKYDPRNTSSPLYGSVVPRKRIWARSVYGNVLYPGFFGTITTVEPRPLDGKVDLIAESVMADLARGRFASSFIENVSYYTVRGRVLAAVLNRDPWLENSTTGASRRARYLHGPEGNNFYTGTDGVVGALDVLDDLNEATGSQHYIQPSVHAMILWKYTSKARTQITDTNSDFTIDEDFVGLSGVRLTHEALENYQQVPWQAFEMGPVPEDDTNGNGSGTVAQAVALGVGYGDVQVDLDPYLHYTREAYGDNGDVPEPTYKVTKRRRRIDRNGDRKRDKGRRFVKRQRIYHDPFVPFTIADGEVRRIAFDFALPVSGPVMSIQGPAGVTAITVTEVEKSPNRYVLDLSAAADTVVDYIIVNGTVWTPLDEEEAIVTSGSGEESGAYRGPGFSTPYIPSAGDAEGLGAYRNWRYGDARLRPTLELGVGQIATAVQLTPSHHITLSAVRWNIDSLLFLVKSVSFSVSSGGLAWSVSADLEELPDHADYFVWDTNAWDDSSVWAP